MNNTIETKGDSNIPENAPKPIPSSSPSSSSSSSSSSPPSHSGLGRLSISNTTNASSSNYGFNGTKTASNSYHHNAGSPSTLMNGSGELIYRKSPISQNHYQQTSQLHQNSPATSGLGSSSANTNSSISSSGGVNKNYYTLGSPSIATSYNSEDVSDLLNSSSLDDHVNNAHYINESLCLKVEQLQRQIDQLSEIQTSQDERYKRTKQENDDLLSKIHCLEDQLRELEVNSDDRAREDERRFKETMAKQMKLKSEECEQHLNNNYQLQQEIIALQKDLMKSETQIRIIRSEKVKLETELSEKNLELTSLDEEIHKLKLVVKQLKDEESVKSNLINILNEELTDNQNRSQQANISSTSTTYNNNQSSTPRQQRSVTGGGGSSSSRRSSVTSGFGGDSEHHANQHMSSNQLRDIDVLEANLDKLRDENRHLKEVNEELQAQLLNVQLEEGRSLIQEGNKSYSLADEMGDIDVSKVMEALKEQQEDNARLRKYMDDILLRIVEKNPEILERTITTGTTSSSGGESGNKTNS